MRTAIYEDSITPPLWSDYTPKQLNQYFRTLKIPTKHLKHPILRHKSVAGSTDAEALKVLTYLNRYQLANIPFENLELHYSTNHSISLETQHLFHKVVERKSGRGGYCLENTYLFITVLRSLGYDVIATGARLNSAVQSSNGPSKGPNYGGWNHMVGIVTIGDNRYLIDVGFGNNSLTYPVPFEEGYTATNGRSTYQLRLGRELIPDINPQDSPSQLLWVYNVRYGTDADAPWIPGYCFGEVEFLPQDFETMSFWISKNPRSWFTQNVVCLKFLMDKQSEVIIGDVSLFGRVVKERKHGTTKILAQVNSEKERVAALEKFLGVKLSETEKKGIDGLPSMIIEAPKT